MRYVGKSPLYGALDREMYVVWAVVVVYIILAESAADRDRCMLLSIWPAES
eukprot:COSAG01_NODE_6853_length_3468_cov_28.165331_2_plen_51_part_00